MEVTLFHSIMSVYSMLYSITVCLLRTELFDRCVGGEYSVETDRDGVKQSYKCLKVSLKPVFFGL